MPGRKLTAERKDDGARTVLRLTGIIDEECHLKKLWSDLKPETVFDLEGIELINSAGVREWVRVIGGLPRGIKLILDKCSPRIVEQINYVSDFRGPGEIRSFYAPYFCPKCKKESNVLLLTADMKKRPVSKAPAQKCGLCRTPLEFDDVEEEYFAFLND